MAVLDSPTRVRVGSRWMQEQIEASGFTKAELQAAVAAADDWVEANTTSFNAALPVAFRTAATLTQKTLLLAYVLWQRMGRLGA